MASATQQRQVRQQEHDPIALLDAAIQATEAKSSLIEKIVDKCAFGTLVDLGHVHRSTRLALGIKALRELLTDDFMRDVIMPLQNSQIGFATDKKDGGYPLDVVRDCYIDALVNGAYATGNEWGIISGRCYLQQAHYMRKLHSIPGIANVVLSPGVPVVRDGKTLVRFGISWVYRGEPGQLVDTDGKPGQVFVVKVNANMGDDAVIGKAKRKACKAACEKILGISLGDDDEESVMAPAKPKGLDDLKPVTRETETVTEDGEIIDADLDQLIRDSNKAGYWGQRLADTLWERFNAAEIGDLSPDKRAEWRAFIDAELKS